jgi:hypothetical protein
MLLLSSIILFTYRRIPDKTIESLLKNNLSKSSNLYIFSDGYKNEKDKKDVIEVRKYLKTISGFKKVEVIEAPKNKGLANSIIDGVTSIIETYEKVIVLEDDVIVSNDFLEYMNDALEFYKNNERIWSISGYTPNLESLKQYKYDVYLYGRGTSWAWGTWINRWNLIDWNINDWNKFKKNKALIMQFNSCGNDMFKMLELQMLGKLDSWAVRWDYNQFKNNMYTVFPRCSKAKNIGFNDFKASNTVGERWEIFDVSLCNRKLELVNVEINLILYHEMKKLHDTKLYTRMGYFLRKYGGYRIVKKILTKVKK